MPQVYQRCVRWVCHGAGVDGVWYRVGMPGGYTGEYPPSTLLEEEPTSTQRSGPRKPMGAGVGGVRAPGVPGTAAGTAPETTTPGPLGLPGPLRCLRTLRMPPPGHMGEI